MTSLRIVDEMTGARRGAEEDIALRSHERHYIGEQGIHAGDILELYDARAREYVPVRYEMSHGTRDGRPVRRGYLIKYVAGYDFTRDVDASMLLRFPPRGGA